MSYSQRQPPPPPPVNVPGGCERLYRALTECHRRMPVGPSGEAACRHLNRSLAQCMVGMTCPDEYDAVRTLCSSAGTDLKRRQCQQAQLSLSACLSTLQTQF